MMPHSYDSSAAPARRDSSIDELDTAICKLARQLNAGTYRWLVLVREFDDRKGWVKWSCDSCANAAADLYGVRRRTLVVLQGAGADASGRAAQ